MSGEIRNIHVLGIIHGNLVVSFQGAGRVRVFVNNEHSLELPETNRLGSTSPFGIDWTKKYSKYITNCGGLRFAEFNLRALPTQVLVVGETTPSVEKLIPATRPVSEELVLTKDLIINDKLLDEGKQLGLIGKEMVESLAQLEHHILEYHTLNDKGRYEPVIDLSFLNMSSMKDSCQQIKKQMQQKEESKRKEEQAEMQAKLEEEDLWESQQLLQEAGDLSYKIPKREWIADAQEATPTPLATASAVSSGKAERRITRYMTAEPDDRGIAKVYIDDPEVANAPRESIDVSFSMSTYAVRVRSTPPLVLGPVDCGVIDPEASSWRLSQGKRLTLSLMLSEAGKINQQNKKRWEEFQAKMKSEKESKNDAAVGKEVEADAHAAEMLPAAKPASERYRLHVMALLIALFAIGLGLWFAAPRLTP
ncbi:unnamed protein product [Effrenium voratum]|nr:unnamed protein product [Effrenium voratum]